MPANVQEWKDELRSLPAKERADLAHFLIESLDEEEAPGVEAAWDQELNRRLDEIHNGTAGGIPADEVFAKLRERYP